MLPMTQSTTLFPYTTLFRSSGAASCGSSRWDRPSDMVRRSLGVAPCQKRSEEHTSELQSLRHLVCRLLLEKKKKHQSFQATAGFRDYAPNAYSSSNGWSAFYQDRKSGSAGMPRPISYAVFCLKKKSRPRTHPDRRRCGLLDRCLGRCADYAHAETSF